MLGFWVLVLWVACIGLLFYQGNRNFNVKNELGVQVFEGYWQLVAFRAYGIFLALLNFALFVLALAVSATWIYAKLSG